MPSSLAQRRLQPLLDRLQKHYHSQQFLSSDPLEFVHRYRDPWDQESVALVSALLAYGNVTQIRKSIESLLSRIHSVSRQPSEFVRERGTDVGSGSPSRFRSSVQSGRRCFLTPEAPFADVEGERVAWGDVYRWVGPGCCPFRFSFGSARGPLVYMGQR